MVKLGVFELENIEYCLGDFQKKFDIELQDSELLNLKTFEEFCALAITKISLEDSATCTSLLVFHRLRSALLETGLINSRKTLALNTPVYKLLPRKNRTSTLKILSEKMAVDVNIEEVPQWLINLLVGILAISVFLLLTNWILGLSGIILTIVGFLIGSRIKVLTVKSVADLVETMVTDHYMIIRSENKTVNRSELKTVIINWFAKNAFIDKNKLQEASFM